MLSRLKFFIGYYFVHGNRQPQIHGSIDMLQRLADDFNTSIGLMIGYPVRQQRTVRTDTLAKGPPVNSICKERFRQEAFLY